MDLLVRTKRGLYCPIGKFYIDPTSGVDRAVTTHVHSDHAVRGSSTYYCSLRCRDLLKYRLGNVSVEAFDYGEEFNIDGVKVTFFPAGHILGSSQVRLEYDGEVWVVSGDYKRAEDRTCKPFKPIKCNVFMTETTFALPIYKWPCVDGEIKRLVEWWKRVNEEGKWAVVSAYSVGKAQRLLGALSSMGNEIYVDEGIAGANRIYESNGIDLGLYSTFKGDEISPGLLITSSKKFRNIGSYSLAHASGWLINPFKRRLYGCDEGFVVSDHVDWPGILKTCEESGASRVIGYHGKSDVLKKWMEDRGFNTEGLEVKDV